MRDIENEIEIKTEAMSEAINSIVTMICENLETGNIEELKYASEILEKLADAKLDCIKGVYHVILMEAMLDPDNEYGKNWTENGPMEVVGAVTGSSSSSAYDKALSKYESEGTALTLNKLFDVIENDMSRLKSGMDTQNTQIARARLMNLNNMM